MLVFRLHLRQQQQQQHASAVTDGVLGGKVSGKLTANSNSRRAQAAA